jgi:hypothetical protein
VTSRTFYGRIWVISPVNDLWRLESGSGRFIGWFISEKRALGAAREIAQRSADLGRERLVRVRRAQDLARERLRDRRRREEQRNGPA